MKTSSAISRSVKRVQEPLIRSTPTDRDSLSPQLKRILDNAVLNLSSIAQSLVNQMKLNNDRDKAIVYVNVVTNLVNRMSRMMSELNEACQEVCREISEK